MRNERGRKDIEERSKAPPSENPRTGHPRTNNGPNKGQTLRSHARSVVPFVVYPAWRKPREYGAALSWDLQLAFVRFQSGPRLSIFHKVFH